MTTRRIGGFATALVAALVAVMPQAAPAAAAPERAIARAQLVEMFDAMRAGAPFNVDGPLLWGYFFFGRDEAKLAEAAKDLEGQGYRRVSLEPVERGPPVVWRLHVERVERHSVDSLFERNEAFYQLAERYGLDSYDGMDVGPAP